MWMQVKNAIQKVDSIHDQLDNLNVTDDLLDQEKAAQINLENALDIEETFWQQICLESLE